VVTDTTTEFGPRETRRHRVELVSVLILSLATLASAWSAFQASLWTGRQMLALARSAAAGRDSTLQSVAANQARGLDTGMFMQYIAAMNQNNRELADFLFRRFRPELKAAVNAWLATRPLRNPKAPSSPFVMGEYSVKADAEARRFGEESEREFDEAARANRTGDRYVMLTVLFSMAMLFAGIGPQFDAPRAKRIMVAVAGALLAVALAIMLTYPVARV